MPDQEGKRGDSSPAPRGRSPSCCAHLTPARWGEKPSPQPPRDTAPRQRELLATWSLRTASGGNPLERAPGLGSGDPPLQSATEPRAPGTGRVCPSARREPRPSAWPRPPSTLCKRMWLLRNSGLGPALGRSAIVSGHLGWPPTPRAARGSPEEQVLPLRRPILRAEPHQMPASLPPISTSRGETAPQCVCVGVNVCVSVCACVCACTHVHYVSVCVCVHVHVCARERAVCTSACARVCP